MLITFFKRTLEIINILQFASQYMGHHEVKLSMKSMDKQTQCDICRLVTLFDIFNFTFLRFIGKLNKESMQNIIVHVCNPTCKL